MTISLYPAIGELPLSEINNPVLKRVVVVMSERRLTPKSIDYLQVYRSQRNKRVGQPLRIQKELKPDAYRILKASTGKTVIRWKSGWAGFRSQLSSLGAKTEGTIRIATFAWVTNVSPTEPKNSGVG
jgi:hypothetical protein